MEKIMFRIISLCLAGLMAVGMFSADITNVCAAEDEEIVLRVSNWEEYIDQGEWDEEEIIELESATVFGENNIINDFEDWYYETYGQRVRVEYSTFGTNEDLYSQLTLGDVYDLVCPSEYMLMKLIREGQVCPLSEEFFDESKEHNYYIQGVSPFIRETFENNTIDGEQWSKYAACYMWGITGIVYNPEEVSYEEASTWEILNNPDFLRQVTIKDNVRDAYFPALGILFRDKLLSDEFRSSDNYREELQDLMNSSDEDTINRAEILLKDIKDNVYSFETDSGKADMVTGKVHANLQWSGDAVYTMDQADEDGVALEWAVPKECTNLWFDGWIMLKDGIAGDEDKQHVAEAFINYMSRPDNVIRNMYYIGYTSGIAGGDSPLIYEYIEWCYGAEDDAEETYGYPLGYFFSGDSEDENYILTTTPEQSRRQLSAQYPLADEIGRSAVMMAFDDDVSVKINQMWINVRCFNLSNIPTKAWIVAGGVLVVVMILIAIYLLRHKIFSRKMKKGYQVVE